MAAPQILVAWGIVCVGVAALLQCHKKLSFALACSGHVPLGKGSRIKQLALLGSGNPVVNYLRGSEFTHAQEQ